MLNRVARVPADVRSEAAFTLIELLVTLVVIAAMLAIAVPSYLGFRGRAERTTAEANLRSALPAVETYHVTNDEYVGMDLAALRTIDASVGNDGTNGLFVVSVDVSTYCLRSVRGGATYYKDGPGAPITSVACT
jgi:prepilin-type N-terminal cleavage/methylation domain-containing protein